MKNDVNHISKVVDTMARAYISAVYFTDTGDAEQPDENDEMSTAALIRVFSDCADFLAYCEKENMLTEYFNIPGVTVDQFAIDFWFTRNGHGAGFWDRGYGAIGDKLTAAAETFGTCETYLSDSGKIEFY